MFSLGRGETSGFSFASSCASMDVAAVALATTCSCGCDGVMRICGVGPPRPTQSHPSQCLCLLVAEVAAWLFFLCSPGEGEQPKCLSTASASLEIFLWWSEQQGEETLIFLSGLDKPHLIKAFCICQIYSSWSGAAYAGAAWSLNTFQAVCYHVLSLYSLLFTQWVFSRFTEYSQAVTSKKGGKKSNRYLSFQSPSRLNRLPPAAHNDNTHHSDLALEMHFHVQLPLNRTRAGMSHGDMTTEILGQSVCPVLVLLSSHCAKH